MKTCVACGISKDESNFSAVSGKVGYLRGECKPCRCLSSKAYAEKNREKVALSRKAYREENAEAISIKKKADYYRDPAATSAQSRARYAVERESRIAYQAEHRQVNGDAVRAREAAYRKANLDSRRAAIKKHRLENPSMYASYSRKRQAAKKNAVPAWANDEACRQYYVLAGYLSAELGIPFHADHKVPLQSKLVCGLHNEFNLNVMLGSWNIAKGNRTWPDMPEREKA